MVRAEYPALKNTHLESDACKVPSPLNPPAVKIDSPAVQVMTDLLRVPPATIRPDASLPEANQSMLYRGVRMLFVTDPAGAVKGIVTANDILGERPVLTALRLGVKREELRAADIMTALQDLQAIQMSAVVRAEVGHIVATLKEAGRQHAIVVETDSNGEQIVRGVFSVSQIARQLGAPITTSEIAKNFAEIEAVIAGV